MSSRESPSARPDHLPVGALVASELAAAPPGEVLLVDAGSSVPVDLADRPALRWHDLDAWRELSGANRYAVGIVLDALDRMPPEEAAQMLARLRDQLCRRVLVLTPPASSWDRTRMLGLGFTLRGRAQGPRGSWCLYDHDVATYNPERAWNNPDQWAHPENHRRFRW